ncbi:hypothetical protein [Nocardia sp. NBC_01329]|uniref:hypothetical protein n=1 Tax=Nocardia sp. NBC_01329 TaxID=2903594 RepID=UPI002E128E49|nr:hypothetical protein OG405_11350 [Nocardia sp. NBC_01329]
MSEPLPSDVVTTLETLLRPDDQLYAAVRAQIPHARIQSRCGCGCVSVNFELDTTELTPVRVDPPRHPIIAEADIIGPEDDSPGEILLFVSGGYLSSLEACSWGDGPITAWPPPEQLRVVDRRSQPPTE